MSKLLRYILISIPVISIAGFGILTSCSRKFDTYQDQSHFSKIFNHTKEYRLYLPDTYHKSKNEYPVVYFFHGWGGRHFKDDNAKLEYEKIQKLADKYQLILVMWDGNIETSESRPYNIGVPLHVRYEIQMKDYFVELVDHIDATYRTKKDRYSRGIIGYSMGGFMSFFLAGKYPHFVSAAVNLTGSPEFYVGYPDNNTLYPLRWTYPNLRDIQLRLHNSSAGELSSLNREVHQGALQDPNLTYEYWEFEGGHKVDQPGETMVFEKAMNFVSQAFKKPQPRKKYWDHYDLYQDFDVWGYSVTSNKNKPGYIFLRHVSNTGFGLYTRQWLPDGPPVKGVVTTLTTAPLYRPATEYMIQTYDREGDHIISSSNFSDQKGKLRFELPSTGFEIGIYLQGEGSPNLTFLDYSSETGEKFLYPGESNKMELKIGNLGEDIDHSKNIYFNLTSNDSSVVIINGKGEFSPKGNSRKIVIPPIHISCNKVPPQNGQPTNVKFNLMMKYDSSIFQEEFDVPVFFDVPTLTNISIDDGMMVKDSVFGVGNADGMASPGEEIMVYSDGHRLQLFSDDQCIVKNEERLHEETLPAKWTYNGVTQSSIITIADNCKKGHIISFLAKYETKEFMPITRNVFWGNIQLEVQ